MRREDDDADGGIPRPDGVRRLDALQVMAGGHPDVGEHDVDGFPLECRQELHRGADPDDDLHFPAQLQQLPHPLADEVVVVGDGHPQHRLRHRPPHRHRLELALVELGHHGGSHRRGRLQPEPAAQRLDPCPQPDEAAAVEGRRPRALVADRDPEAARRQRGQHHSRAVRSRVLEHVGQRLGDHEERGALDLGREADGRDPGIGVDGDRDGQQGGPRLDRRERAPARPAPRDAGRSRGRATRGGTAGPAREPRPALRWQEHRRRSAPGRPPAVRAARRAAAGHRRAGRARPGAGRCARPPRDVRGTRSAPRRAR